MPVQNAEVAAMFDQAAELLEIEGENQFRVRAYRRAARVIEGLPQSIKSMLSTGRDLSELPGIGKDLAGKIAEIVEIGHFPLLELLETEAARRAWRDRHPPRPRTKARQAPPRQAQSEHAR